MDNATLAQGNQKGDYDLSMQREWQMVLRRSTELNERLFSLPPSPPSKDFLE